jgi:shikimate dehydrogenase
VLGSGGAARAISITIAREAAPDVMTILGVDTEELNKLIADVQERGQTAVRGGSLDEQRLKDEMVKSEIVLHCSPVGMHPREDQSLVPSHLLRDGMVVFDAVYNPRQTKLLQDARAAGCRTIQGLEMFLGQAYVQFELWTGQKAPRDVMRRVVEAKL